MTLSTMQARDVVIGIIDAAWKASPMSSSVPMLYDNVKGDAPDDLTPSTTNAAPFARTTVRILVAPQSTQGARRRFLTTGIVSVQVFTAAGDGHAAGDALAQVIIDELRGHVGSAQGVWFYDVVPQEIGVQGAHFQINVSASFRYQEVV